jgi:hypothetical protein
LPYYFVEFNQEKVNFDGCCRSFAFFKIIRWIKRGEKFETEKAYLRRPVGFHFSPA